MKSISLKVFPRSQYRRVGAKKVRHAGRIPAVIYGFNPPENLEVPVVDLERVIHHSSSTETVLVDLSIDGAEKSRLVLVKDVQHHPISRSVLHVDFHEVKEDVMVTVTIPVESVGEAPGVKIGGGLLEHVLFEVKVKALPRNLPEVIKVDVSELQAGGVLHIGDIKAPEGVEILGDKQIPVLAVTEPKLAAAEEETAGAGAAPAAAAPAAG